MIKKTMIFIFAAMLTVTAVYAETADAAAPTAQYILSNITEPVYGSVGGEWAIIGLSRSGIDLPEVYCSKYLMSVEEKLMSSDGLGRKYTEYSRIAMAVASLGLDAHDFGAAHINLFNYINDYDSVIKQGLNGPIFALEAKFLCGDTDNAVCKRYIEYILSAQNPDGSFGLSQGMPDTDITAMAASTLCLYNNDVAAAKAADRAFLYLSAVQHENGGFNENKNDPEISCESTAQVVIAMRRRGLSDNDCFFNKNGNTPLSALYMFKTQNSGYKHKLSDTAENQMSTEQALLALTQPRAEASVLRYDSIWFNAGIKYLESIKQ